jgi:hypothetical protein
MEKPQPHGRTFDVEQSMRIVRENALAQSTPETRENYFKACEAKGPELAAVVAEVRKGLT